MRRAKLGGKFVTHLRLNGRIGGSRRPPPSSVRQRRRPTQRRGSEPATASVSRHTPKGPAIVQSARSSYLTYLNIVRSTKPNSLHCLALQKARIPVKPEGSRKSLLLVQVHTRNLCDRSDQFGLRLAPRLRQLAFQGALKSLRSSDEINSLIFS